VSNLDKWEKLARPPESALKKINGGRLKGMTDISPQWRYKAMTEVFGPAGKGWSYTIEKLWTEEGVGGEIMAFAQVNLVADGLPIPGIGGSKLIAKETGGMHNSDEAYKMAVTDALSVAMKMLGVGADIYMGMWDGSKYKDSNPVADAIIRADVKPLSGVKEQIQPEQVKKVDQIAGRVLDWLTNGSVEDAVLEAENADMDTDEKAYFWTLFDSKQRSAMKKEHERIRKQYAADPATQI
jgi:hypothetical protein